MRVITKQTKQLEKLADIICPLIFLCDEVNGLPGLEPASIKVGNYLFQDANDGTGELEVVILEDGMDINDYIKWHLLEIINPEVLFESEGILKLHSFHLGEIDERYKVDMVQLNQIIDDYNEGVIC